MKKTILKATTVLAFLFLGTSLNAQNSNDNGLIGKARGAASDCISNYVSQGFEIAANVETTGICFVSGSLHKVTFYSKVKCHSEICPMVMSAIIATVYFDCDNNVSSVECSSSAQ
jgi:hypothetical protein